MGLTFDYGPPAPGANVYCTPPHEPPQVPEQVLARFVTGDLRILGNQELECPVPGSLFRDGRVQHTVCALFLGKPPLAGISTPSTDDSLLSTMPPFPAGQLLYRGFRLALEWERNTSRTFSRLQRLEIARTELQAAAEERLALLGQLDAALQAERRQSDIYRTAAEQRLKALLETDAALRAERALREMS
jgi:hypothetical protein